MINLSDYYKGADGSNLIFNNGNSNGSDIVIGTNDNYSLALEAGGIKSLILAQNTLSGNSNKTSFGAGSATGTYSFAEGSGKAFGSYSHAEGQNTSASGNTSHAEGFLTIASGTYSHAEGGVTTASGDYSHAEGSSTTASGSPSHAEGALTIASGQYSHAEGYNTTASGQYSHAEGSSSVASGNYSHVEGNSTATGRRNTFLLWNGTTRVFTFSPSVSGNFSYVTAGTRLTVVGPTVATFIVASRDSTTGSISATTSVLGSTNYPNGQIVDTSGTFAHAEGLGTTASGVYSHTEGVGSTASGSSSHAEGASTTASGSTSHAEGISTTARGTASHAAGSYAEAAYDRSWIWKGSTATNIISTTRTDQFMVSAAGGVYIPGNVGIGTDANDQALTVVGTISTNAHKSSQDWASNWTTTNSNSANWSSVYTTVQGNSGNYILDGGNTKGANIVIGTNDNYNISFETNGANRLLITNNTLSGNSLYTSFNAGSATGLYSFAAGSGKAFGSYSHAEGQSTTASGDGSHAEGFETVASQFYGHAEGSGTTASNEASHAEGSGTQAAGAFAHAEGFLSIALGQSSHAEGRQTKAIGDQSHTEGNGTETGNRYAYASYTAATRTFTFPPAVIANFSSVVNGSLLVGRRLDGFPQDFSVKALSRNNITGDIVVYTDIFFDNSSNGYIFGVEGGTNAHAEGNYTRASGNYSHAEGSNTVAAGESSHAAGAYAAAAHDRTWAWHGSTATNMVSTTRTNQFMVSAAGGVYIPGNVGIGTAANDQALTVVGTISTNNHNDSSSWARFRSTQTSNFTAFPGSYYIVNTTSTPITGALPASPSIGTTITFQDSFIQWQTNNFTINRNGNMIQGLNENMICDRGGVMFDITYIGGSIGWRVN